MGVCTRGARRGRLLSLRSFLFDVKTVHAGGPLYATRRAREDQSGVADGRAASVHVAYVAHAAKLDREIADAAGAPRPARPGPVESALLAHPYVRGLCFSQRAAASLFCVHELASQVAQAAAERDWRAWGARMPSEAHARLRGGPVGPRCGAREA